MPPPYIPAVATVRATFSVTINWGAVVISSAVVVGVESTQSLLVVNRYPSLAAMKAAVFVVVPRDNSPELPGDGEGETEELGDNEADGLIEALGESDFDTELDGLVDADIDGLLELEGLREADGETEDEGLREAEILEEGLILIDELLEGDVELEGLSELLGDTDALGEALSEVELDGDTEADGDREVAVRELVTLPNKRNRTAPVTVNRV